jgi:hypothetical protein
VSGDTSPLREALRAVTRGTGLSREEARAAFTALFDGHEQSALGAAFLAALAARGETAADVAGLVDVLRARSLRPPVEEAFARQAIDVCGTGGDHLATFNISTAAAFVVAGAGVPVAHGGRAVSSAHGSADVLAGLGWISRRRLLRRRRPEAGGAGLFFAPVYHAAMKRVAPSAASSIRRHPTGGAALQSCGVGRSSPADRPERIEAVAGASPSPAPSEFVCLNEAGGDGLSRGEDEVAEVTPEVRRLRSPPRTSA